MREKTLKCVCTSAAFLAGAFIADDVAGIAWCTIPAVLGGLAGAILPEWDNIGTEYVGGPSGKGESMRLGNLIRGGNPVLKDVRKKYLTEEERRLSSQTAGGLRYETHSLLALAVAELPFLIMWLIFQSLGNKFVTARDVSFGLMIGFGAAYLANIICTVISYGTYSRNGARILWPIVPVRLHIPLIHSEELMPDGGDVKDRRKATEKLFTIVVSLGLVVASVVILCIRTGLMEFLMKPFG